MAGVAGRARSQRAGGGIAASSFATWMPLLILHLCLSIAFLTSLEVNADDEERLIIDKFRGYNNLIRPVHNVSSAPNEIHFGMAMILLINVDEKNQIMQTNVWLTLKWTDFQMKWNRREYGGIETIRVPPDKVWIPDIVLFNNADGNYEVSFHSNVVINHHGEMLWVPPAIYKSSCRIDVEFFPFDDQICQMQFGSWTYNRDEVQLKWYNDKAIVELNDYQHSGIWDIMDVPGQIETKNNVARVSFDIKIRRKTLFYTVILIIPTVLMAFLSMMVFYLPADCSEKITLAISILLALVVFLLLVSKILPPTSDTIPLMAKYLLMTFVMNIVTILVTVIIINIYFRGPTTHTMPQSVRFIFLKILPRLVMMKRPKPTPLWNGYFPEDYDATAGEIVEQSMVLPALQACMGPFMQAQAATQHRTHSTESAEKPAHNKHHHQQQQQQKQQHLNNNNSNNNNISINNNNSSNGPKHRRHDGTGRQHHPNCRAATLDRSDDIPIDANPLFTHSQSDQSLVTASGKLAEPAKRAIAAIEYITNHLKQEDEDKKVEGTRDDWKYMAMVIDRLVLYVFFGVTLGGTAAMIVVAPNVFTFVNQQEIIEKLTRTHGL